MDRDESWKYVFTIFIPTYNRAHLLPRALDSIAAQTYQDFEILIIDDGSTDGTRELVKAWQERAAFPLRYIYQENQGKHVAHNTALNHALGFLTVILDSDDQLSPDALERLLSHWNGIPTAERHHFAGVEGLCARMGDGTIAGSSFPQDVLDADYLTVRRRYRVSGDKKNAIRTDVLREFPFPVFPGERHIRPSLVWKRMAHRYKFRFINEVIQYIEYQQGGLSADRFRLRMRNPRGFRLFFQEEINLHAEPGERWKKRYHDYSHYVRFSIHSGVGLVRQIRDIDSFWIWILAWPAGTLEWMGDRIRMRHGRD
jgi:glycosyltransferase involved in cell wall biosynthesis